MEKVKIKSEDVIYEMAEPASKMQIVLWLLTGGRKGKLFVRKKVDMKVYSSRAESINCRSTVAKVGNYDN